MSDQLNPHDDFVSNAASGGGVRRVLAFVRLARVHQWTKNVFVLAGPVFNLGDTMTKRIDQGDSIWAALTETMTLSWVASVALVVLAFGCAASVCYVINDIRDVQEDRQHPRKRKRPIASGAISVSAAIKLACGLGVGAALSVAALAFLPGAGNEWMWVAGAVVAYIANVTCYTIWWKHIIALDVISLSMGFVLRVLGGCAAVSVEPTTWLLNSTLFLSMFLALGKRLGERRTAMGDPSAVRSVQSAYTDDLLRMMVVVTAVATLMTYAQYVQSREAFYMLGFNLLWLTIVPATFALFRTLILLERGAYDDPTELAMRDRGVRFAGIAFVLIGAAVTVLIRFREAAGDHVVQ